MKEDNKLKEAIIPILQRRLKKEPDSIKDKKELSLTYYSLSGHSKSKTCKLYLRFDRQEQGKIYCKEALKLMEELFNRDEQVSYILIKEHYNYSKFLSVYSSSKNIPIYEHIYYKYIHKPLNKVMNILQILNKNDYDEFQYLKELSTNFTESNPLYSYNLALLQDDVDKKLEYLQKGEERNSHLPSIYEQGLVHKSRKNTQAIEKFKKGAEKGHLASLHSLYLLTKKSIFLNTIKDMTISEDELKKLDDESLYVYLFSFFDRKDMIALRESLNKISGKKYNAKISSLETLIPILEKQNKFINESDYKNLDGHALAMLGYMVFKQIFFHTDHKDKLMQLSQTKKEHLRDAQYATSLSPNSTGGADAMHNFQKEKNNKKTTFSKEFSMQIMQEAIKKGYCPANLFVGKVYFGEKEIDSAEKFLKEAYRCSANVDAAYILGRIALGRGLDEEANKYFLKFSKIDSLSDYLRCTYSMQLDKKDKDVSEIEECLKSIIDSADSNHEIKILSHYTTAVLNIDKRYSSQINVEKAQNHLSFVNKSDIKQMKEKSTYIQLTIDLMKKNCTNIDKSYKEYIESDVYFKYMNAIDRLDAICSSNNAQMILRLVKQVIEAQPVDEKLSDCAYLISQNQILTDDCRYIYHPFNITLDLVDSTYREISSSDIFKEDSIYQPLGASDEEIESLSKSLFATQNSTINGEL